MNPAVCAALMMHGPRIGRDWSWGKADLSRVCIPLKPHRAWNINQGDVLSIPSFNQTFSLSKPAKDVAISPLMSSTQISISCRLIIVFYLVERIIFDIYCMIRQDIFFVTILLFMSLGLSCSERYNMWKALIFAWLVCKALKSQCICARDCVRRIVLCNQNSSTDALLPVLQEHSEEEMHNSNTGLLNVLLALYHFVFVLTHWILYYNLAKIGKERKELQ